MKKKTKLILMIITIIFIYWFSTKSPWAFFSERVARDLDRVQYPKTEEEIEEEEKRFQELLEKYAIDENKES